MTRFDFVARARCDSSDAGSNQPNEVLERAVAKMVQVGARVGLSSDQMIELLDAGMTVEELLEYVLSRARNLPEGEGGSFVKSGFRGEMRAQDKRGDCNA